MIKVAVIGALGKMGSEVIKAVTSDEELELVAAIDKFGAGLTAHGNIKIENNLKSALERTQPDIAVDFTEPNSILDHIKTCFEMNVRPIVGTTGLKAEDLKTIEKLSNEKQIGCFIAPNFTIGAVLMMMFAKTAAKYFNNSEIIEFHHNQKKDYPSGTAIKTAEMMSETNKDLSTDTVDEIATIKEARGGVGAGNVHIHSVRMPGYMASQEVIFGSSGQILTIKHDSFDRKCYMGGVILAIKHTVKENNFIYGLENIL